MDTRSINFKSDFLVRLMNEVDWSTPFSIRFFTTRAVSAKVVAFDGENYVGCTLDENTGALLVPFERFTELYRQGLGTLRMELTYRLSNALYPDQYQDVVLPAQPVVCTNDRQEEFYLSLGLTGDDDVEVSASVVAPFMVGPQGTAGTGISTMVQTSASMASAGANVWKMTLTDGREFSFTVLNGAKGDTGAQGPQGPQGAKGAKGDKGDKGDTGARGPQGEQGPRGVPGQRGEKGAKGDKGDRGLTGETGPAGNTPLIGQNGNWWIGGTDTGVKADYSGTEAQRQETFEANEANRQEEFDNKEATRDAANQAALDCAETLAALGPKIDKNEKDLRGVTTSKQFAVTEGTAINSSISSMAVDIKEGETFAMVIECDYNLVTNYLNIAGNGSYIENTTDAKFHAIAPNAYVVLKATTDITSVHCSLIETSVVGSGNATIKVIVGKNVSKLVKELQSNIESFIKIANGISLMQGYVGVASQLPAFGILSNRVRTSAIKGPFTIKTRDGYRIHQIAGCNADESNAVIVSNARDGVYVATGYDHYYVTFAKTDNRLPISPSEDIIDYFYSQDSRVSNKDVNDLQINSAKSADVLNVIQFNKGRIIFVDKTHYTHIADATRVHTQEIPFPFYAILNDGYTFGNHIQYNKDAQGNTIDAVGISNTRNEHYIGCGVGENPKFVVCNFIKSDQSLISPSEDIIKDLYIYDEKFGRFIHSNAINGIKDALKGEADENVEVTLSQGYIAASSDDNTNTTRVKTTYFFVGNGCKIKTKQGYKIRGISIFSQRWRTNGLVILSNGNVSEYTIPLNLERPFAAVTFCKDTSTQDILPTEDIVDSITRFGYDGYEERVSTIENTLPTLEERVSTIENTLPTLEERVSTIENTLPTLTPPFNPIGKVVFMGDSITHGVYSYWNGGVHDDANRYNGFDLPKNFAAITNEEITAAATAYHGIHYYFGLMAKCEVVNLARRGSGYIQDGRNGGTFLDLIEGNANKTLNGISPYDFSDVDMVLVFLGINDYINHKAIGNLESFNSDGTYTRGTIIGNLAIGLQAILAQNPLCKIIVFSPYNSFGQVSKGGDYKGSDTYGTEATDYALGYDKGGGTLQDYINAIDAVCQHYGVQHVPLSKSNVCNRLTLKDIMIDGLHPSKESYPYLAAEIFGKSNYGS